MENKEEIYDEYIHTYSSDIKLSKIKEESSYLDSDIDTLESMLKKGFHKDCPVCKSINNVIKYGRSKNRLQRYKCKKCNKIFSDITGSPLSYSKKPLSLWIRYMFFMKDNTSLRCIANTLNINLNTSFQWRHKILSVLGTKIMQKKLNGIIEVDETKIREDSKGRCKTYSMRNRTIDSNDYSRYITLLNCRDNTDNKFIKPVTKEFCVNKKILNEVLTPIIKKDTGYIATPNRYEYLYFSKENNLKLSMATGKYHVKGIDNKKAHKRGLDIKRFIRKYRNICSKYLSFYIYLFVVKIERKNGVLDIFKMFITGKKQLRVQDFNFVNYKGEINVENDGTLREKVSLLNFS